MLKFTPTLLHLLPTPTHISATQRQVWENQGRQQEFVQDSNVINISYPFSSGACVHWKTDTQPNKDPLSPMLTKHPFTARRISNRYNTYKTFKMMVPVGCLLTYLLQRGRSWPLLTRLTSMATTWLHRTLFWHNAINMSFPFSTSTSEYTKMDRVRS